MKRRWIIRSFFMLPLALWVTLMILGHAHELELRYAAAGINDGCEVRGTNIFFWFCHGSKNFDAGHSLGACLLTNNLSLGFFQVPPEPFWEGVSGGRFDWSYDKDIGDPERLFSRLTVSIPLWVPIPILAALLLLVWRKTRPKLKGRAFPVESGAANGGQT